MSRRKAITMRGGIQRKVRGFCTVLSTITANLFLALFTTACSETLSGEEFNSAVLNKKFLYVASGACYSGGVAASTGSATVAKYDLTTGVIADLVIDYNTFGLGDMPSAIKKFANDTFLIGIENAGGRRIDIVARDGTGLTTYLTNATALNAAFRDLAVLNDSSILVAKATAVEKFAPSRARVTQGANPFVNAPAGACATSTTVMSSTITLPDGKIVYAHAAATPNNKVGVISASGYAAVGNCLAAQAAPATTALPTSVAYHLLSGKLLVAYASTTSASNFVYSYDIDLATGVISNPIAAWTDFGIVYGASKMIIDQETGFVYIANGAATYNNIEKFSLSAGVLTKIGTTPFINTGIYTRCIAGLEIAP
ncbi:MAG: hypothetical protein J0L82_14345 [Deltaproteobacteria bacterium]|nr:hypothetical protein [Deltaproteobacteria bacterium]